MTPVEINAGNWYMLARDTEAWADDSAYGWSVCEATTADVDAIVVLRPDGTLTATPLHPARGVDAAATACDAVTRFAEQALGLTVREAPDAH